MLSVQKEIMYWDDSCDRLKIPEFLCPIMWENLNLFNRFTVGSNKGGYYLSKVDCNVADKICLSSCSFTVASKPSFIGNTVINRGITLR